jgi:hypothetical protein
LAKRSGSSVSFGDTYADSALLRRGGSSEGLNTVPEAKLALDSRLIGSAPIDYWAPVASLEVEAGQAFERFAGVVRRSGLSGPVIDLECEGAAPLTDHTGGGMLAANMEEVELLHSMIALSGSEGELQLSEDPPEREVEDFEVIVPIHGLTVERTVRVAEAEIIPRTEGEAAFDALEVSREGKRFEVLAEEYRSASSYARARVQATQPHEAEETGIERIEAALAWLTTRARYGSALMPDGSPQLFDRSLALRAAERGAVVLLIGAQSARQWIRWPHGARLPVERELAADSPILSPPLPPDLPLAERQALLALRAAATQTDLLAQVQSLWQAIESYCAGTKCRPLFSPEELATLKEEIPLELDKGQRKVLSDAIGRLNDPPLKVRLLARLRRDGVSLSDGEITLLEDLRRARNDTVHGREISKMPNREEINYGIGVVARMLVHRVAA